MYDNKTARIMKLIVKICYFALGGLVGGLWLFATTVWFKVSYLDAKSLYLFYPILLTILLPVGYVALAHIDMLLTNVIKDKVFEESTLKHLDIISYSCVIASVVVAISLPIFISRFGIVIYTIVALAMLVCGALFMALLLKVVKKVFQRAIALKEENDLTI